MNIATVSDRTQVLAHWLRLCADDRRMRFLRCMSDAAIEAQAAAADFDATTIRLGSFDANGELVAMVEGYVSGAPGRATMEIAFSTDAAWRRLGLASALGAAIADEAARRGVVAIVARCDTCNAPMKALLKGLAVATERDADEWCASGAPMAWRRSTSTPALGQGALA